MPARFGPSTRTLLLCLGTTAEMPDHLPQHADDPQGDQAFAFGYGYIKALLQVV